MHSGYSMTAEEYYESVQADEEITRRLERRTNENLCGQTRLSCNEPRRRNHLNRIRHKRSFCMALVAIVFILFPALYWALNWAILQVLTLAQTVLIPTAPTHPHPTLAVYKEKLENRYINNTFLQMLQCHQLIVNTTDCWVCGLLPASAAGPTPFIPYPLSCSQSTATWYTIVQTAYSYRTAADKNDQVLSNMNTTQTQAILELKHACVSNTTTAESEDTETHKRENKTFYDRYFTERTYPLAILVYSLRASHCVRGQGKDKVGNSECDKVTVLDDTTSIVLMAPKRTFFICGTNGYTWLPANWSGICYIAFLLPPTFTASSNYHERYYSPRQKRRVYDIEDTAGRKSRRHCYRLFPILGSYDHCTSRQSTDQCNEINN